MKKLINLFIVVFALLGANGVHAVDNHDLLPAEQAFVPKVVVGDDGVQVDFKIADGYYLYQGKIHALTEPKDLLGALKFSEGKQKHDEFFGDQIVYYHQALVNAPYQTKPSGEYRLTLQYQGCADVGICYPPASTELTISGNGVYGADEAQATDKDMFVKKPPVATNSTVAQPPSNAKAVDKNENFRLSRDTIGLNLLAFFVFGLGLSFTACMYPLLPIVSSIVVGDNCSSKKRAFLLTLIYVQGLALTYTLVGVLAGLTGALLTVWLQQAWVVLSASVLMVVLALSMFGVFNIQLPSAMQAYFQNKSSKLSGGQVVSVFVMGMLSALIVGPCVAPPLAFALGYIGQTGDALLGGLALYALALGTGVPLLLIGTFGGHILPRAGVWMNGIKSAFGVILLAVAVYLATPYLPYAVTVTAYALLLLVPAVYMLKQLKNFTESLRTFAGILSTVLLLSGGWFVWQSVHRQSTVLHEFLTLHPKEQRQHKFSDVAELKKQMNLVLQKGEPVMLDFYADWCVSCQEMEAKTFNQPEVKRAVPLQNLFTVDVTANAPEHQALLKEYGLFGPPGLFMLYPDGTRSEPVIGFVPAEELINWFQTTVDRK